jgi:outer membrane protein TolC
VASEAIKQLEELTSNQEARMEQGMSTEHDYLLTKASLAQARINELKVNKSVSSMKRQFAILLGLPATTEIVLIDTSAEGSLSPHVDLDSAVSSALSGRPDLKETRLKMDLAELGIKSAKSAFYPTIVAGFGYSNESPEPDVREQWRYNWAASVSLKFNLLDWGDRNFKLKKAREQQLALKEILQEKTASVEKEVLDAYHEVEQLQRETEAAELLMEAREKAYEASLAKYEEGVIPMYELLDAHNSLISAKYAALQTATSLKLAIINLDMGGLGSGLSNNAQ